MTESVNLSIGNQTYDYGLDLYYRWCKENERNLISESDTTVKDFLLAHKDGWPTNKPKTLNTVRMRLQAVKKLYEVNGSKVDFKPLSDELSSALKKKKKQLDEAV